MYSKTRLGRQGSCNVPFSSWVSIFVKPLRKQESFTNRFPFPWSICRSVIALHSTIFGLYCLILEMTCLWWASSLTKKASLNLRFSRCCTPRIDAAAVASSFLNSIDPRVPNSPWVRSISTTDLPCAIERAIVPAQPSSTSSGWAPKASRSTFISVVDLPIELDLLSNLESLQFLLKNAPFGE